VEAAAEPEEPSPLPDSVIVSMLRREALLTKAKLHCLVFEHLQQDKSVRTLKSQLKQVCVRTSCYCALVLGTMLSVANVVLFTFTFNCYSC
jgi:hypothetical protein